MLRGLGFKAGDLQDLVFKGSGFRLADSHTRSTQARLHEVSLLPLLP